jgi:hypothetical protein
LKTEDIHHLFACEKKGRWRQSFLANLNDTLRKMNTNPGLKQDITQHINEWFQPEPKSSEPYHFLQGFVRYEWIDRQQEYERTTRHKRDKKTDEWTWATKLILFMWKELYEVWKTRNEEYHNETGHAMKRERREALEEMQSLYDQQREVGAHDRALLFARPMEEWETHNTKTIKTWNRTHTLLIGQMIREQQNRDKNNTRDIREIFPPKRDNNKNRKNKTRKKDTTSTKTKQKDGDMKTFLKPETKIAKKTQTKTRKTKTAEKDTNKKKHKGKTNIMTNYFKKKKDETSDPDPTNH